MTKTQSVEWAECFMSYLVHLYEEGAGHAKLKAPKEVDAYTQEYKVESDTIARFILDYVHGPEQQPGDPEVEIPDPVSWSTITATFQEWKRANEVRSGSTDELRKRLESTYGKMPRNGWTAFRFGVGE
jgi:phage/plasmid-associated DNA primase